VPALAFFFVIPRLDRGIHPNNLRPKIPPLRAFLSINATFHPLCHSFSEQQKAMAGNWSLGGWKRSLLDHAPNDFLLGNETPSRLDAAPSSHNSHVVVPRRDRGTHAGAARELADGFRGHAPE
jgi:hypothetical protein